MRISIYRTYVSFCRVCTFFDNFSYKQNCVSRTQRKDFFTFDVTRRFLQKRNRSLNQIKVVKNLENFRWQTRIFWKFEDCFTLYFFKLIEKLIKNVKLLLKNSQKTKVEKFAKSTNRKSHDYRSKTKEKISRKFLKKEFRSKDRSTRKCDEKSKNVAILNEFEIDDSI